MKIKEVAARTGLTEKAIRFYESKRLITPQTYELNARTFREYTEENVRTLLWIAALRRAFFSVSQISEMLLDPSRTGAIFAEYRRTLTTDYAAMTPLIARLDEAEAESLRNIEDVAALLAAEDTAVPAPKELRLSPSDDTPPEQKNEAYQAFLHRQSRRDMRDAVLSFCVRALKAFGCVAAALVAVYVLVFVLNNVRIRRDVSVTVDAIEWQEGRDGPAVPRTITLTGQVEDYLFRNDRLTMEMTVSGYSALGNNLGHLPRLTMSRPQGGEWGVGYGSLFDTAWKDEAGEDVLFTDFWMEENAGVAYFVVCEGTGHGSYTYDPNGKSSIITIGLTDPAEARILYEYVKITDRTAYEKRMAIRRAESEKQKELP